MTGSAPGPHRLLSGAASRLRSEASPSGRDGRPPAEAAHPRPGLGPRGQYPLLPSTVAPEAGDGRGSTTGTWELKPRRARGLSRDGLFRSWRQEEAKCPLGAHGSKRCQRCQPREADGHLPPDQGMQLPGPHLPLCVRMALQVTKGVHNAQRSGCPGPPRETVWSARSFLQQALAMAGLVLAGRGVDAPWKSSQERGAEPGSGKTWACGPWTLPVLPSLLVARLSVSSSLLLASQGTPTTPPPAPRPACVHALWLHGPLGVPPIPGLADHPGPLRAPACLGGSASARSPGLPLASEARGKSPRPAQDTEGCTGSPRPTL